MVINKIKINLFVLFLVGASLVASAQQDSVHVRVFPNPFDSVAVHEIQLNEGDQMSIDYYNMLGQITYSIAMQSYFESVQFSKLIKSQVNGVYFARLVINGDDINKKLFFIGQDSTFALQFNIQVTPSKFKKETLIIFPNPVQSDNITIETETESTTVDFQIFNMQGQLLYQKEVQSTNKKATLTVTIADWESGQYVVKMNSSIGSDEGVFTKISN